MGGLIVFIALLAAAGGIAYLVWLKSEERRQNEREFCARVLQALRTTPISEFNFRGLAQHAGVSGTIAQKVAHDVYREMYSNYVRDGVIAHNERQSLTNIANCLLLERDDCRRTECQINENYYRAVLDQSLADGTLTAEECTRLENLKQQFGLSERQVRAAAGQTAKSLYLNCFRQISSRGRVEQQDLRPLAKLRSVLGLSDAEADEIIRPDMIDLYRQRFCIAKQDGRITPEEEQELNYLQRFLGLGDGDVQRYRREIERIKFLDACRRGRLPSVQTSAILEGGEICHYDDDCVYWWFTSSGNTKEARGRLRVTSDRIIFSSDVKNFDFKPSKVTDLEVEGNRININATGTKGTGLYWARDPELLEAVLYGVVSLHKYITPDSFSSDFTRHIPDDVKRKVWSRDGGRCVKCGAREYLEFDHIIPHSKGGSNSERNIQLLCRNCNLQKSDRI